MWISISHSIEHDAPDGIIASTILYSNWNRGTCGASNLSTCSVSTSAQRKFLTYYMQEMIGLEGGFMCISVGLSQKEAQGCPIRRALCDPVFGQGCCPTLRSSVEHAALSNLLAVVRKVYRGLVPAANALTCSSSDKLVSLLSSASIDKPKNQSSAQVLVVNLLPCSLLVPLTLPPPILPSRPPWSGSAHMVLTATSQVSWAMPSSAQVSVHNFSGRPHKLC